MKTFKVEIFIIGVNPYVLLPHPLLQRLMQKAKKEKGPIPVQVRINKTTFTQTLVKYAGKWRLYLNLPMRKAAGKDVGDIITIGIAYDAIERTTPIHSSLQKALDKNKEAKETFENLPPSRQKEIARYINRLKTEASVERAVKRAVSFLLGRERFVGRDKP